MKQLGLISFVIIALSVVAFSQPRPVEKSSTPDPSIKPAPASFTAKYEGGLFGFTDKETGTLRFDDEISGSFFLARTKEKFGIPYASVIVV